MKKFNPTFIYFFKTIGNFVILDFSLMISRFKELNIALNFHPDPNFDFDLVLRHDTENIFKIYFNLFYIIEFICEWTRKTDHAGFYFRFSFIGLEFYLHIHDIRHWDYDLETWEK